MFQIIKLILCIIILLSYLIILFDALDKVNPSKYKIQFLNDYFIY